MGIYKDRIEFVRGNASQPEKLEETVKGTEAVLSTLPPIMSDSDPSQSAQAMEALVTILERNSIKRFIHIGGAVHGGSANEKWTLSRQILKVYLNIVCKPVLVAKQLEWDVLRKSNLDWTLVRPPRIVNGKSKGHLAANETNLASVQVNVEDLAEFMLEQINSEKWIEKAPLVATAKG